MDIPGPVVNLPLNQAKNKKKLCNSTKSKLLLIAVGALCGFILCLTYISWLILTRYMTDPDQPSLKDYHTNTQSNITDESTTIPFVTPDLETPTTDQHRDLLYVGVYTIGPYLTTRARACKETWASKLTSQTKLQFYAAVDSTYGYEDLPLVSLPEDPNDTWHTRKSLHMLEHMCENHVAQFDWFMRAVDDTYVDLARLVQLLRRLDPEKKILLGHPTLPIEDVSFRALNGREYCLGGPGLVMSRTLLTQACPYFPTCRERFGHLPADVALAKCISVFTSTECAVVPKLHDYFVHSFERNQLSMLEEFNRRASRAIAFHPLKQPWMMQALHHNVLVHKHSLTEKHIGDLKLQRTELERKMKQDKSVSLSEQHSFKQPEIVFLSPDGHGYSADYCPSQFKLSNQEKSSFEQSIRLANTSISWGHTQRCTSVISGLQVYLSDRELFVVDLQCQSRTGRGQDTLARSVIARDYLGVTLNYERAWKTSRHLVVVIQAQLNDPYLIYFMLGLRAIVQSFNQHIIVNIIYEHSSPNDTDNSVTQLLIQDLTEWAYNLRIIVRTFRARYIASAYDIAKAYSDSVFELSREYPDATVFLTSVRVRFTDVFLKRCMTLVKQGHQGYIPQPINANTYTSPLGGHSGGSIRHKFMCIHIADIVSTSQKKRKKTLKEQVNFAFKTAFDNDLVLYV